MVPAAQIEREIGEVATMTKDIVLCFDRFFLKPIMVLLKSIEISNPGEQFVVHVVFSGDGEKGILKDQLIRGTSSERFSFHFYEIDDSILSCCPIRKGDHVNIATYYRILLPTILPSSVERVLYLDGDMIVVDKLSELWSLNIKDYGAAVVPDIHYSDKKEFERLGLNVKSGYFNAGLMLINLAYWRQHDIQNKTISFIQDNPERCKKHDQDALNFILSGKLKYISHRFNYQRIFYERDFSYVEALKDDITNSSYNPCVIHYCDLEKPWHRECFHPLKDIWLCIARKTPGVNNFLLYKYKGVRKIRCIIKSILVKIGVVKPVCIRYTIDFQRLAIEFNQRFENI